MNGKDYPPSAKMGIPGLSWVTSMFGGGGSGQAKDAADTKGEGKGKGEL